MEGLQGATRTLQARDRARRCPGTPHGRPRLALDRPGHALGVRAARFEVAFLACKEVLGEMMMLEEGYMATSASWATLGTRTARVMPPVTDL